MRTNPQTFWWLVSPKVSTYNIQLAEDDGNPIAESECPEALNDYFVTIVFVEDDVAAPIFPVFDHETMQPILIFPEGIRKLIEKQKCVLVSWTRQHKL